MDTIRNDLDKKDRKKFDEEMFDISRLYISACSNSVQYVRLHPILMSILLYNYKELTECIEQTEQIEAKVESLLLFLLVKEEKDGKPQQCYDWLELLLL
jgi:hypothetical protein